MSDWKQRRFWTSVEVQEQEAGFAVTLDGRGVKTPAKAALCVPTRAMALAVAAEWEAQEDVVNPNLMPFTRSANAAIDKVAVQHSEVADMLAAYGDADLLCYRAQEPEALVRRQSEQWDPVLDWAAQRLNARLEPRSGVMHLPQDAQALEVLRLKTHGFSIFELTAFHDLVSLSGSLILGFVATYDYAPIEKLWETSRLDEIWQEEQWGVDEEAQADAMIKRTSFLHAKRFFEMAAEGNSG